MASKTLQRWPQHGGSDDNQVQPPWCHVKPSIVGPSGPIKLKRNGHYDACAKYVRDLLLTRTAYLLIKPYSPTIGGFNLLLWWRVTLCWYWVQKVTWGDDINSHESPTARKSANLWNKGTCFYYLLLKKHRWHCGLQLKLDKNFLSTRLLTGQLDCCWEWLTKLTFDFFTESPNFIQIKILNNWIGIIK